MTSTTISIDKSVKELLNELKLHPREPYSSVVERLVRMAVDEEPLSDDAIEGIEEALEDIRLGRVYSEEDIKAEFDIR